MGEVALLVALLVTLGHMVFDILLAVRHATHPLDTWLTMASIVFLTSHIVATGEGARWLSLLH